MFIILNFCLFECVLQEYISRKIFALSLVKILKQSGTSILVYIIHIECIPYNSISINTDNKISKKNNYRKLFDVWNNFKFE